MKIIKLVSITPNVLFEGVWQNVRFNVLRVNNVLFDLTIADFPIMNVNNIITTTKHMGDLIKSQIPNKST